MDLETIFQDFGVLEFAREYVYAHTHTQTDIERD